MLAKIRESRPYQCTYCGNSNGYSSIENGFGQTLKKYKFPYALSDFETLSYRNYKCPGCNASDRERMYKIYIEKYEKFLGNEKILDFAPSIAFSPFLKTKSSNYRSADLLVGNVDDKVDITDMKMYKNDQFDFFVCSHILEHVSSDELALTELHRVLKVGGRGILMTPIINKLDVQDEDPTVTDVPERWRRFAQDDHVRLYEKKVFLERVNAVGFKIHTYGFWNLGLLNCVKNGISFKSRLYIVEKRV